MPTPRGQKAKVKNWPMYERLRAKGMSKKQAAITTNHAMKTRKKGKKHGSK